MIAVIMAVPCDRRHISEKDVFVSPTSQPMPARRGARRLLSAGLAATLGAVFWTASREHKIAMAEAAAAYRKHQRFARTPFLHIEGPYLNPAQAGAQDTRYMRSPDADEIRTRIAALEDLIEAYQTGAL